MYCRESEFLMSRLGVSTPYSFLCVIEPLTILSATGVWLSWPSMRGPWITRSRLDVWFIGSSRLEFVTELLIILPDGLSDLSCAKCATSFLLTEDLTTRCGWAPTVLSVFNWEFLFAWVQEYLVTLVTEDWLLFISDPWIVVRVALSLTILGYASLMGSLVTDFLVKPMDFVEHAILSVNCAWSCGPRPLPKLALWTFDPQNDCRTTGVDGALSKVVRAWLTL
jgi:hypothetical protein